MKGDLLPGDFCSFPHSSTLRKCEAEQVAINIMVIRKRLGNLWPLKWGDYQRERQKDGEFTMLEKVYFEQVMPLISDPIGAISFSSTWANDARKASR